MLIALWLARHRLSYQPVSFDWLWKITARCRVFKPVSLSAFQIGADRFGPSGPYAVRFWHFASNAEGSLFP